MKDPDAPSNDLLHRVKGEFLEMPGLRLSATQAERLWGLAPEDCERVLQALVDRKFLTCGADGKFGRFTENSAESTPLRMAKSGLNSSGAKSTAARRHYS